MITMALNLFFIVMTYSVVSFVIAYFRKRNDSADFLWGVGFIVFALSSILLTKNVAWYSLLILFLVTLWGLRLAFHVYLRQSQTNEDPRYLNMSENWGQWFYLRSYFQVNLLQAILSFFISLPALQVISSTTGPKTPLFLIGLIFWVVGFVFEVVGDYQLQKFKNNQANSGKILDQGLWAYTRHPNYFGEVLLWWGIWIISLSFSYNPVFVLSPLLITYLILYVSGVPLLEKQMSLRSGYSLYSKRVSKFFPMPPVTYGKKL